MGRRGVWAVRVGGVDVSISQRGLTAIEVLICLIPIVAISFIAYPHLKAVYAKEKASKSVATPATEPAKPSAGSDVVWESAQSLGTIKTLPTGERIFIYTIWYQGRGLSTSAVLLPPLPVAPVEK